jgi:hypothetical protein
MTQEFFRRIDGYNRPFIQMVNTAINNPNNVSIAAPAGPGRIEEVMIVDENATNVQFPIGNFAITIDGATLMFDAIYRLFECYGFTLLDGPWVSVSYLAAGLNRAGLQLKLNAEYESSASVTYYPTAVAVRPCRIDIIGRMGR